MPYPYIYSNGYILGALSHLPPNIQQAAESMDIAGEVVAICSDHDLLLSETGEIFDVVRDTIAGKISAKDFAEEVRAKLEGDNKEKAETIVAILNERIFLPLRKALQGESPVAPILEKRGPSDEAGRKTPYSSTGTFSPRGGAKVSPPPSTIPVVQRPKPTPIPYQPPARPATSSPISQKPASAIPSREELLREIETGLDSPVVPPPKPARVAPAPANLPTGDTLTTEAPASLTTPKAPVAVPLPPAPRKPSVTPATPAPQVITPPESVPPPPPPPARSTWKVQPKGATRFTPPPATPPAPPPPGQDPYREPIE